MAKILMSISVRGKRDSWTFEFYGNLKHVQEWRDDGLEIQIIEGSVPGWIADLGLTRPWCFVQNIFHFKNPFAR